MKKITFTLLSTLISLLSIGQISGGFLNGTDYSGNMFVYFKGTNISQNSVQIKIKSVNEQLDQEKSWDCKLSSGDYFTVGLSDNWIWQSGEKLVITYPDGTSYYWIYVPLQNYNTFMTPSWMDNILPIVNDNQFDLPNSTEQYKVCYTCRGHGRCVVCGGSGVYSAYGFSSTCSACSGTGKCWHCQGSGKQ